MFHLIILNSGCGNEDCTTGAINRTGEMYDFFFFYVIPTIILEIVEYMNRWIKANCYQGDLVTELLGLLTSDCRPNYPNVGSCVLPENHLI